MPTSTTNYAHPYISIQIYDNTEFTEEAASDERKSFNGMQVGFFAGGRDNQLLYMQSQLSYLREFGDPNFRKFGQAAYNVDNALATDNCGMYVMNLRPETATYANIVIMVRFKLVEVTDSTEDVSQVNEDAGASEVDIKETEPSAPAESEEKPKAKKLVYAFYAKTIEKATDEDKLTTAALDLMQTDPDEKGFYNMPFMLLYSLGRGEYGNSIHMTFGNATEYATESAFFDVTRPEYHLYTLTVMEPTADGLSQREINYGGFDVDGFDKSSDFGPSTFMADVINDVETGSQRIHAEIYTETLDVICKMINEGCGVTEKVTPATLDLLTGLTLDGTTATFMEQDTKGDDYINLFSLDGFTMNSGNDGWDGMDDDAINKKKDELLIAAYSGDIDPFIKSRFSSPCDFNLDANYSLPVKKQMAALAGKRLYDCMTYLDTGLINTTSGLISVLSSLKNIYGFNVVKECHNYKWRDKDYTGKICNMTITHWLAKALPNHMADPDIGLTTPLARDEAILQSSVDYIPGSFKPVIDPDSDDIKNTIYRLRGNCYETLTYRSVQRSTAITSCQSKSDRLLEMNEYILQRAVAIVYRILASKIYKLGEQEDRDRYEEDATDIINEELKGYVRTTSVRFEMTPADEKKSLLRLILHITFKTVIQNGEIKIYLDPRVTDTVTTTTTVTSSDDEE